MTKQELKTKTDAVINETRDALQEVYDALNNGQQNKLMKNERIVALFERYGVQT